MSTEPTVNATPTPPQISAAPPARPAFKKPTPAELAHRYMHHPPVGDQADRYAQVRAAILAAALQITELTPVSPEQTRALNALDEAMFLANAAIARHERRPAAEPVRFGQLRVNDETQGFRTLGQDNGPHDAPPAPTAGRDCLADALHHTLGGPHCQCCKAARAAQKAEVLPASTVGARPPETAQRGVIAVDLARGPDLGCVVCYDFATKQIIPGKFVCDGCGAEYSCEQVGNWQWQWTNPRGVLMHGHGGEKETWHTTHFVPDQTKPAPINISPSDADMAKV